MINRRLPLLVAMRVSREEKELIRAVTRLEGLTEHEFLRRILLPEIGRRLAAQAGELATAAPSTGQAA